jgi:hypothetical protein
VVGGGSTGTIEPSPVPPAPFIIGGAVPEPPTPAVPCAGFIIEPPD